MEKPGQDALKCPRCDSCNTKFCYYNNYSLSQPRYFCKACKRYWTRGGTLRNVPVGGGCRKNKRVKRAAPPSNEGAGDGVSAAASNPPLKPDVQPEIDLSSPNNPSIYNPLELNFPFSRFNSTRVFDYHHQMNNGVGSGFSSGPENYENGLQDFISNTNNSSSSSVNPIFFGSSNDFSAPTSTMGNLQKFVATSDNNDFSGLMAYDDMMRISGFSENGVKIEGENGPNNYQINEQINSSDSSSLLWNYSTNIGSWFDPNSNMGSSVPSLI